MLMLRLRAQLGNQMFQYAAARAHAARKGFAFAYRGGSKGRLGAFCELAGESRLALAVRRLSWLARPKSRRPVFKPRLKEYAPGCEMEAFDASLFEVPDGTEIEGAFQSERYFADRRADVLRWTAPKRRFLEAADAVERTWKAPPEMRCGIHLRRTDYTRYDLGLAGSEGWALPTTYYEDALKSLPAGLSYVIASDDPDFAEHAFSRLPDKTVLRGNPGIVDMELLSRCRTLVIANSSFSWWAAWRCTVPGKAVFAPKHHLGWAHGTWVPEGIEVPGWTYLDVRRE
ncbi:MAG: alpha-1,2-fucosyltransferase [Planctomycetota bacterium]